MSRRRSLVLEVTETSIISDFERSKPCIDRLRDLGVVVSIDDFGAGFTSLAHLSGLAVGELKLDRAFITGLARTAKVRDLELVRATIELGHAMGLRVVAEGIEDDATLKLLSKLWLRPRPGLFHRAAHARGQAAFPGDDQTRSVARGGLRHGFEPAHLGRYRLLNEPPPLNRWPRYNRWPRQRRSPRQNGRRRTTDRRLRTTDRPPRTDGDAVPLVASGPSRRPRGERV